MLLLESLARGSFDEHDAHKAARESPVWIYFLSVYQYQCPRVCPCVICDSRYRRKWSTASLESWSEILQLLARDTGVITQRLPATFRGWAVCWELLGVCLVSSIRERVLGLRFPEDSHLSLP